MGEIQGRKGNEACHRGVGVGYNKVNRYYSNGGKREGNNNLGPVGEYARQRRKGEVPHGH